jgi:hypothetical protein
MSSTVDTNFHFPNPKTIDPKERRMQRFFEILPGALTWATFVAMVALSFLVPIWMAVFIIIFDIYWIHRAAYVTFFSALAYQRLEDGKRIDWWNRCQNSAHPSAYAEELRIRIVLLKESKKEMAWWKVGEHRLMRKQIQRTEKAFEETRALLPIAESIIDWRSVVHVVMLPTAGESVEVIEPAIEALLASNFPKEQMIVLLATEERENPETRLSKVAYLEKKFKGKFKDFLVTTHIVADGEMKCKASNATFAAHYLMGYLDECGIDYTRVVFSNFDCDSVVHPEYFAALTYAYATNPKRLQRAYQPLPVYHNNLWDTNAFARMVVTGSSFWHLYQSLRREMVTFSSHSEAFDTLVRVGFWPVNMISEDSVIYWKCLSYFHGDYEVRPIHLPISLDAVLAETYWKTVVNQYKQNRRWAYGIENFPVTMRALWPDKIIPFWKKLRISFEMLEGHYSWATTSFLLTFLGWLPIALGGAAFRESVLAHNLPLITKTLLILGMMGLCVSVPLSLYSMPPRPKHYHWMRYSYMLFQWILIPIVAFLSAVPAIDSQTRILTKNYFGEFWVTEKIRKRQE